MTQSEKSRLLKMNTILWLAAMVLPAAFYVTLGATKFPWPLIIPLLLFGAMLSSNSMLSKAIGEATDATKQK